MTKIKVLINTVIKIGFGVILNGIIEEYDDNYIKLENGLCFQWGRTLAKPGTNTLVSYPISFTVEPYVFCSVNRAGGYNNLVSQAKSNGNASFYVYAWSTSGTAPANINTDWIAVGKWK